MHSRGARFDCWLERTEKEKKGFKEEREEAEEGGGGTYITLSFHNHSQRPCNGKKSLVLFGIIKVI